MIPALYAALTRIMQRRSIAFSLFGVLGLVLALQGGIFSARAQEINVATVATTTSSPSQPFSSDVDLPPLPEQYDAELPLPAPESSRSPGDAQTTNETPVDSSVRRFQYAFRLTVRGVFDDNINLDHDNEVSDFYVSVDPIIILAFGDAGERKSNFIEFDYRPRLFFFTDHPDNNAFENIMRLEGQYSLRRGNLHASQEIQLLDSAEVAVYGAAGDVSQRVNLDVAGRTQLNLYTTVVDATYDLSSKSFLSGGATYVKYDYPDLISSAGVSGNMSFNYHYSEKTDFGLEGVIGLDTNDATADQTYQQVNIKAGYSASGKLTVLGSVGLEFRQFEEGQRDSYVTPIFSLGVNYHPFDGTTIGLHGSRRTYNSAVLAGQDYTNTNFRLTVRQRLLRRFQVGANFGVENSEYVSAIDGITSRRSDDYFYVQPAIDVNITRFWTVGAFYLLRHNDSSIDEFGFHGNEVGIMSTLTF